APQRHVQPGLVHRRAQHARGEPTGELEGKVDVGCNHVVGVGGTAPTMPLPPPVSAGPPAAGEGAHLLVVLPPPRRGPPPHGTPRHAADAGAAVKILVRAGAIA